jgi:tetratricopeptide (TPR) repeat protein
VSFLLGNHPDIAEWIRPAVAVPGEADPDLRTVAEALHVIALSMSTGARERAGGQAGVSGQSDPAEELGFPGLADRVEALDLEALPLAGLLRPGYAMLTQDTGRARRYIGEALAGRDEWLVAASWILAAALAENDGDMETLRQASDQALERFRVLGERWGLSTALRMVGSVRILDGDLDGATAAFAEASHVMSEMGSRDDQAHTHWQLADIAARRGELDAAREFYQAALEAAASDGSGMDAGAVSAGYAMFEVMLGDVEQARLMYVTAEQELTRLSPAHPGRHHVAAAVAAGGLMIALADGDLPLARERALRTYQQGVAAEDMPLLASVAGALAYFTCELDQPERAAEMLGACAAVRGGEDPTDLMLTMLGSRLRAALGTERYGAAYDRGKALSRAEAVALLDPAGLG